MATCGYIFASSYLCTGSKCGEISADKHKLRCMCSTIAGVSGGGNCLFIIFVYVYAELL